MRIVLLPGLLCDAGVWDGVAAALRGHGEPAIPDLSGHDSLGAMAETALASAEGPLAVVGHSMGGRVALEMVRQAPGRVTRLALLDTGVHPRGEGEEARRQELVDLAFADGMAALADRWLPPMVAEGATPAVLAALRAMILRATPESHARQIRALLDRPDAAPLLPAIACPTLVLVGRQDRWSPLAQHAAMAAAIPGATLVVVEDAGHFAPAEQPGATAAALLDWLAAETPDRIPDTPLFDRARSRRGYRLNKMAMGLGSAANRKAFLEDEGAYLDRFGLRPEERAAVLARDWREMVRLGGNLFYILKISAVDPVRITEIGAHQAGMAHETFLRERLGKG